MVSQTISPEPGFTALLKGHLTRAQYKVITVYIDNFSKLHFMSLQQR